MEKNKLNINFNTHYEGEFSISTLIANFLDENLKYDYNQNTATTTINSSQIEYDEVNIINFIEEKLGKSNRKFTKINSRKSIDAILIYDNVVFSTFGSNNMYILGKDDIVSYMKKAIVEKFPIKDDSVSLKWYYTSDNGKNLHTHYISTNYKNKFYPEMYPYLNPYEIMDNYMSSNNPVLILIGEPGTGKTHFIKELIKRHKIKNTNVVYDEVTAKHEQLMLNFMTENDNMIIFEDADKLISDRIIDQNGHMSKLLNLSDGLIPSLNKKMIFTANIKNISEIDHALTRPGRCFDVIQFRPLTIKEAEEAASIINVNNDFDVKNISVSEIFNQKNKIVHKHKIGF